MTPYVELRAHSAFSFGDGAVTPERLVARAAELGYAALGLTDTADLGGALRFAAACDEHDVRPIVGVELVVDERPLALLARTAEGYRHLAALVTRARAGHVAEWGRPGAGAEAPPRGHPRVGWRDVAERAAGVTLLTGPMSGRLAALLRRGRRTEARRTLAEWRDAFGAHLAVEVQHHHAGRAEEALAGALVELAERVGVPWVVTNDPRYLDGEGRHAHDVLVALRHGCTVDEAAARGLLLPNDEWRLHAPATMAERWAGREEGLERSAEIADACGFARAWVRPPLPDFPLAGRASADALLREQAYEGARVRWGETLTDVQTRQIEHELDVIARLGFAGFFLVMWDAVREARRRNILCQGRGSAANSAVNFCLGVTAVDPVKHGLLFERFLSPVRADGSTDAPDIDLDVEHDRREELLDYVYATYGRGRAAIACITQHYSAPTAVQDVCRAHGVPAEQAFALSKRVHGLEAVEGAEALRGGLAAAFGLDVATPRGEALLRTVAAFDRLPRMRSTHPGGFVLSAAPLGDYCPIEPTTMGRTVLQFDKDDLDDVGIPKFDFLGLGALSAVRHAFDAIERRGEPRPEMYALPQDDPETFAMVARGDTVGMFQVESRAQISSLVHTRPTKMYDLVVQVALIRPGPIVAKFVHPYVERRRGREAVTYPGGMREKLEPILARTQGIPIFQEQAMRMVQAVAGYSPAQADELRRTMGHSRKAERLAAELDRLHRHLVANGAPTEVADALVAELRGFANYGFPESHAWSFALIAYATAWLKAHRPAAFYLGLLNAQPMGFYSVATLVHDARRHGVEVRLPCLRRGADACTLEETDEPARPALRVGWRHARGLGARARAALAEARAAAPFAGIADVVRRAALTRADATTLARAHAFAAWEPDRRRAAWEALRAVGDVLPLAPAPRAPADEGFAPRPLGPHEAVVADYDAVGLSVAGHPMERYRGWCRRLGILDTAQVAACQGMGEPVLVAGLVLVRQRPSTANGTVFLLLEDEHGTTQVIVHPKVDAAYREVLRHSPFLLVYGRAERDMGGPLVNVIARRMEAVDPEVAGRLAHRSHDFR